MNKEKLEKYALLKAEEKRIKAEISILGPDILSIIIDEGADKIETEVGVFTSVPKKSWKFSEVVKELKENVKKQEANEMADGTATFKENPYLLFSAAKI